VVDGVPVVEPEKFDKLKGVLTGKIFGALGQIRDGGFFMPVDAATQKTKGYCFIEFSRPEEAQAACVQLNGYRLDKNHVFTVNPIDDVERFARVPDEYEGPRPEELKAAQAPAPIKRKLYHRLLDRGARDQFSIR
jgi:translation initiation factor 3 subunit B